MPEPKLPAEYAYGYVIARAIRAVADSTAADDPYPDGPPVSLNRAVIFRPLETGRIIKGAPLSRRCGRSTRQSLPIWTRTDTYRSTASGACGSGRGRGRCRLPPIWAGPRIRSRSPRITQWIIRWTCGPPPGGSHPHPPHQQSPSLSRLPSTTATCSYAAATRSPVSHRKLFQGPPGPPGPIGATGQPSTLTGTGPGRPDIISTLDASGRAWVQSAPVGALWASTDGAEVGAWQWQRTPKSWRVTYGMTPFISFQDTLLALLRNFGFTVDPIPGMRNGVVRHNNLIMLDIGIDIKSKPDRGENLDIKSAIGYGWIWKSMNINNANGVLIDFSTARIHWANGIYVRIWDTGHVKMSRVFLEMDESMTWPTSLTNPNAPT